MNLDHRHNERSEEEEEAKRVLEVTAQVKERFYESGKHDINNLLWEFLPPWTTMAKAEEIACEIHRLVRHEWEEEGDVHLEWKEGEKSNA